MNDREDLSKYPEQEWPDLRPHVYVSWTQCDCGYGTDYCDENHSAGARVPLSVLNQYDPLRSTSPIRYEED